MAMMHSQQCQHDGTEMFSVDGTVAYAKLR